MVMFNDRHSHRLCLILIMSVMYVNSCSSLLRLHQNAYSYDGDHMQLDLLQKHRGTKPGIRDVKLATLSSSSSVVQAYYVYTKMHIHIMVTTCSLTCFRSIEVQSLASGTLSLQHFPVHLVSQKPSTMT